MTADKSHHQQDSFLQSLPEPLADLLRSIASEEDEQAAAALQEELKRWPGHQAEIREWLATLRLARVELEADRTLLTEIESQPTDAADLELVRKLVEAHPVRRRPRPGLWLAAAAALVALGLGARQLLKPDPDAGSEGPPILLADSLQVSSPIGAVDDFGQFEWEPFELPPFGEFRLDVRDLSGALLFEATSPRAEYTPTVTELESLADAGRIVWRVDAYDRTERRIAWGDSVEAWLPGF